MSACSKAEDGKHTWQPIGRCYHSHSTGGSDYEGMECSACGLLGHRGPLSFACGAKRRNSAQMGQLLEAEAKACPISQRKAERKGLS